MCLSEGALAQVLLVAGLGNASEPPGASVVSEPRLVFLAERGRDPPVPVRRCCSTAGGPAGEGSADGSLEIIPVGNVLVRGIKRAGSLSLFRRGQCHPGPTL